MVNSVDSDLMKLLSALGERQGNAQGLIIEEKKYGLIGGSVSHSLSKRLHGLIGGYAYSLIELRDATRLGEVLRMAGFYGFNITNPYKEAVIEHLDELSEEAEAIQAVNTVKLMPDGKLRGYNTDYLGIMKIFVPGAVDGKKVAILGTGGASLSAVYAAKKLGAREVVRVSRNAKCNDSVCRYEDKSWRDAEIIINATPVGMFPDNGKSPFDAYKIEWSELRHAEMAVDLIYNPHRTKFIQDAEVAGVDVIGGLGMLIWQGIHARDIWEGREMELDYSLAASVMERLLREQLNLVTVGMPGSGKSSITRQVARAMKRNFIDIDRSIARDEDCPITQIIDRLGLEAFRELESKKIKEVCSQNYQVIATGGGSVLSEANRELIRENSIVIYIDRPTKDLATKNRPLSQSRGVHNLYRERAQLYHGVADVKIRNKFKFGGEKQIVDTGKKFSKKQETSPKQSQYMRDIRRFARSVAKRYKIHIRKIVDRDIYGIGR